MTSFTGWLGELDETLDALHGPSEAEQRLDVLIDRGVSLLAGDPAIDAPIDPTVIARVQQRLRAMADAIARELEAVRRERRELTKTSRAHAGYQATAAP